MDTLLFSCKSILNLVKNAVDGCRMTQKSSSDLRFVNFILFYANRDFSQFTGALYTPFLLAVVYTPNSWWIGLVFRVEQKAP